MEGSRPATADDVARIAQLAELARLELMPMKGGALWAAREAVAEPFADTYEALVERDDALVVVGAWGQMGDVMAQFDPRRVVVFGDMRNRERRIVHRGVT